MFWSVMILAHVVISLVALSDMAALEMTTRARAFWIVVVVLAPLVGVAAFVLFGRSRWGGGVVGWLKPTEKDKW